MRADTAKAALWGTISGVANVALAFVPGSLQSWYFALAAIGYGLLLPMLAVMQVRHRGVRDAGAILGTAAGMATITVGIAASANAALVVPALFVRGVWWWTIGKMWADSGVLPRGLGRATMALAAITFVAVVASAPMGLDAATIWTSEHAVLGLWTVALSFALYSGISRRG